MILVNLRPTEGNVIDQLLPALILIREATSVVRHIPRVFGADLTVFVHGYVMVIKIIVVLIGDVVATGSNKRTIAKEPGAALFSLEHNGSTGGELPAVCGAQVSG